MDAFTTAARSLLRHQDWRQRTSSSGCTPTHMPAPFLSILIDDCIAAGRDYNAGGARYNTTYIMPVGIGTVTDSLSAIRCHVFEQPALSQPTSSRARWRATSTATNRLRAAALEQDAALRQRRCGGRRHARGRLRSGVCRHRWQAEHARRTVPRQLPVDHVPRLFRLEGRAPRRTGGTRSHRCRRGFRPFRARTVAARRPCCVRPRAWTTRAPAGRC